MPDEIREKVQQIFRDVFENPTLTIRDDMTAADIPGWDSLEHINLIIAMERSFRVKFSIAEISGLENVGQFLGLLRCKVGEKG